MSSFKLYGMYVTIVVYKISAQYIMNTTANIRDIHMYVNDTI